MNQITSFIAIMKNVEIRKCEDDPLTIDGKVYPRLKVHVDDENGERLIFIDKDVDSAKFYEKGMMGTLHLLITIENVARTAKNGNSYVAEKTKIEIDDFIPD